MKKVEKSHKLLRNLKSQGLSLNTIIIAAIVLIVLIVLWAIFTGRMGRFTTGVKEQEEAAKEEVEKFEKMAVGGCSEGQTKCADDRYSKCEDGEWKFVASCAGRGCNDAGTACTV